MDSLRTGNERLQEKLKSLGTSAPQSSTEADAARAAWIARNTPPALYSPPPPAPSPLDGLKLPNLAQSGINLPDLSAGLPDSLKLGGGGAAALDPAALAQRRSAAQRCTILSTEGDTFTLWV